MAAGAVRGVEVRCPPSPTAVATYPIVRFDDGRCPDSLFHHLDAVHVGRDDVRIGLDPVRIGRTCRDPAWPWRRTPLRRRLSIVRDVFGPSSRPQQARSFPQAHGVYSLGRSAAAHGQCIPVAAACVAAPAECSHPGRAPPGRPFAPRLQSGTDPIGPPIDTPVTIRHGQAGRSWRGRARICQDRRGHNSPRRS